MSFEDSQQPEKLSKEKWVDDFIHIMNVYALAEQKSLYIILLYNQGTLKVVGAYRKKK